MLRQYFAVFIIISFAKRHEALEKCTASTRSVYGHSLSGHVISINTVSSLAYCIIMCSNDARCKSMNFRLNDKSCDLNDADRHTHPGDYGAKEHSVYMDTSKKHKKKGGFKSCAEVHQYFPQTKSGYYWVKIGDRDAQVYCDMENYGGGWTLAVSISSNNNEHLQRNSNNCLNSILCVPFTEKNVTGRKLSDEDIHTLAQTEGTFRVDVSETNDTIFYKIPSGAGEFNSTCHHRDCPRIIISHSFPYHWETNNCTTTEKGYRIAAGCYRVFDGHDDGECGYLWFSKGYREGRRALYGFPCPEFPQHDSLGIYKDGDGMLFVK